MTPAPATSLAEYKVVLEPSETLIWSGRPLKGIRRGPGDLLLIPFSLLWGGGVIAWEVSAWRSGVQPLALLPTLPFVVLAIYLIAGRFFADGWARARTVYIVTDRRVIISAPRLGKRVLTLPLDSWDAYFRSWSGNVGFISFQQRRHRSRKNPPKFAFLVEAWAVHEQIKDLQRSLAKRR